MRPDKLFFYSGYLRDKDISDEMEESFVEQKILESTNVSRIEVVDFGYTEAKPKGIILVAHWKEKITVI